MSMSNKATITTYNCRQETAMFEKFSEIVLSGKRDPFWAEVSLLTQKVLDACLQSMKLDGAEVLVA